MTTISKKMFFSLLCAGVATAALAGSEIKWNPQGGSTDISDPKNWEGGVLPGSGDAKSFNSGSLTTDYTVTIPAGKTAADPYVDKATLLISSLQDGQTVTLDATGTSWLQKGDGGVAWFGNYATRFKAYDHIFDVDNTNKDKTDDNFAFQLTDGTISFTRDTQNGSELVFNGNFNNAIGPNGEAPNHRTVLFHDTNASSANSKIIFHSGESTLHWVQFRGKTAGNELRVDGGHLHVKGGLYINDDSTGYDSDAYLHVTGSGQLTVDDNNLWIGRNASGRGVLRIDGSGKFNMSDGATITYFPDAASYRGLLSVGGKGEWASAKQINVGHNGGTADILVEENGYFNQWGWLNFGSHNGCNISLTLKDDARGRVINGSIVKDVNAGYTRTGTINLSGNAVLDLKSNGDMANTDGSVFTLNMTDNAQFRSSKTDGNDWIMLGNNSASTINLNLNGGTIGKYEGGELIHFQLRGGPQSVYNFAGVTLDTQNFAIEGKTNKDAPDAWHIARQTAGTVNIRNRGSGDGLDIRGGNGRNCMYLLEGGTLNVGNMMRVGHNMTTAEGETWRSVFRQTGGQANLSCNVNLCDSETSGEVELLGGRTRLNAIRGWNKCVVRGGKYMARAYFNGGTIEPWSNGITVIYTMSELKLGAKGLTVDTLAFDNVAVQGLFENDGVGTADEVEGLFVKKGTGTLKAKMKETSGSGAYADRPLLSTHTYTRVDEGTLQLTEAEDAAFGQNITVLGGATLSLEGTAKTLTVDTLALGDGTPFATLKLDAGDTVVVEAENGLTAASAQLDAAWITDEGTYPIFICKAGVNAEQLDNINLKNAPAGKDNGWLAETDEETGVTTCSIVIAPAGTLTSTIDYADGKGTRTGTGPVAGITGSGTASDTLKLAHTVKATVEDGSTLALGGELKGLDVEFTKLGSGKLTVTGENADLGASFVSQGGYLDLVGLGAFGALNYPVVLGNGTFKYTGEPAVFTGGLELRGNEAGKSVILENDGDMTFDKITHVRGTFIKKGVGTLTLNLPAGTHTAGNDGVDGDYKVNEGKVNLPANGDAPESKAGLCGFSILEGTLKIKGAGMDKTTFATENTSILASSYPAKSAPILEIEDARVNFGKGSRHARFMADYPDDAPVPEIRLKNAYLYANSGHWGSSTAPTRGGLVKMTFKDSVAWGDYNMILGYAGYASIEMDADNSRFETDGTQLLVAAKRVDLDFHGEGAVFGSFNKLMEGANNAGYIASQDHVTGLVKVRDGARMKATRGIKFNYGQFDVEFDGGIFEIVPHDKEAERIKTSSWNRSGKGFKTTGNGLEIAICEGSTHDFNFPIIGDGSVTKTGAGTFKLVAPRAEGEKLLQNTGLTTVAEGTLVLDGTLVAEGAKLAVAAGATLDLNGSTLAAPVSGAGTITNGKLTDDLTLVYGDEMPTFSEGVLGSKLTVDFTGTTAEFKTPYVVGHYTGAAPAGLKVKAVNTGLEAFRAVTTCEGGDIKVTLVKSGLLVLIK